jgi:hypothetical protein
MQARALLNGVQSGEAEAEARARNAHPGVSKTGAFESTRFSLSSAQLVVAREHGFPSWPKLKAYVEHRVP